MFVNKIPFLITVSRGLHFGTIELLPNHQILTVGAALSQVIDTYHRHGFWVTTALADPEFEALQLILPAVAFNYCAQNEHVPEIERYIRTVKDRTRSGYNSLPFEQIPRIMLIHLVRHQCGLLAECLPTCRWCLQLSVAPLPLDWQAS